jgi:hypothetical protein
MKGKVRKDWVKILRQVTIIMLPSRLLQLNLSKMISGISKKIIPSASVPEWQLNRKPTGLPNSSNHSSDPDFYWIVDPADA